MFTFIAFLFTIAGSVNWLLIGLLQYDYIAGFFGFQAALMSRIFYVLFGIGAVYLVLRVIINKGTFKIWERKKKKQKEDEKSLEKDEKERKTAPAFREQNQGGFQPAYANIEASKEQIPQASETFSQPSARAQQQQSRQENSQPNEESQSINRAPFVDFGKLREFRNGQNSGGASGLENGQGARNVESENFENSFPQNSPSNSSAPENFFEPPQEKEQNETLFDEHMNTRK